MNEIDKWKHLFIKGEYPEREKILRGLKHEDVIKRPDNIKNSIFDELWHMTMWQNKIVLNDDEKSSDEEYKKWNIDKFAGFPEFEPKSQKEWDELAESFLTGLNKALNWCESDEKLETVSEDGFSVKDSLYSLAIHNAYHLGKIVALRQQLDLWPPKEK